MRADRECGTSWSGCGLVKRSLRCRFGGIEPHITSWFQSHSRDQVFASPCRNHRENRMAASQGVKALGRRELFSWRTLSIISLLEENPTHRSTDTTFLMNPWWYTGFASSRWPKYPGVSVLPIPSVSHFIARSMVPIRGSLRPPRLGRPFSYVSEVSISQTDILRCKG